MIYDQLNTYPKTCLSEAVTKSFSDELRTKSFLPLSLSFFSHAFTRSLQWCT